MRHLLHSNNRVALSSCNRPDLVLMSSAHKRPILKIVIIGTVASSILGFRREFIESLLEQGHEVYAFATDYTSESMRVVAIMGATPVLYSFNRTGMNPLADAWNTWKLARQLKSLKPDLVFSYFAKPVIFGTLAARLAGVERRTAMLEGLGYIFTDQPEGISRKTRVLRQVQVLLYRASLPLLDKLIFLNPDDPKDLLGKHNIKVRSHEVLGGIGLDLAKYPYSPPPRQEISFLFIARLLKEKGINEFLAAAQIVKSKYPHATFKVLGGLDEGNPGGVRKAEMNRLVASGLIDYPGHVSDIPARIANSSVFVLPSYREGVPRSTQEAMAIGRPVITTDVPGCRETVIDGVNGFLVPPWQPEALAEKMIYFIEHPEQIEPMGLESHRIAMEKFDVHMVNQKLLKILNL